MTLFKNLQILFQNYWSVLKRIGWAVFIILFVSICLNQFLNQKIEAALRNPLGLDKSVWVYGIFSLMVGVILPLFALTITLYGISERSHLHLGTFIKKHFNLLMIENLRALGSTITWTLCFIVPGIYKFVSYAFVPLIVIDMKEYDENTVDALKKSQQLVRRRWKSVLLILIFFYLIFPLSITSLFDGYNIPWETTMPALAMNLIDTLLFIFGTLLLFQSYQKSLSGGQ